MTLDDFLVYVLPDVPGCPSALAKQAVLDTAIDFLTHSKAWNEVQDPITLLAGTGSNVFDLEAPVGARCIDLRNVYTSWGSGQLVGKTLREISMILPTWQIAEANLPTWFTRAQDFSTFTVYPIPTTTNGETITPHAVYTLKRTATTLPDDIVDRFRDAIADGAKFRLKSMTKKTWSDPARSKVHRDDYEAARSRALVESIRDKTPGALTVTPRRFGQ
jgi:hypothetical protein